MSFPEREASILTLQRAIITGATGAVGTALTELLLRQGVEVLIISRTGSARNGRIPSSPLAQTLFCDLDRLDQLENETGKTWDCLFHFAWAGASGEGRNDMYLQNANVKAALDAVGLAARFGCRRFVGAGSQAEYGRHAEKLTPATPTFPETGYGFAKLCAGQMTRAYAHQLGMEHVWLRLLSIFGPHDGKNSMIAQTVLRFQSGESPEFTAGEQIWDYVYSKDAAKAFFCVAQNGIDGKTYVLGSGEERPLAEYLTTMRDLIAPSLELKLGARPYAGNQVMFLAADSSELTADTGYHADYTFEDGIRELIGVDPLD